MNYSQRMYSKTELGLPYFPDTTDGATARRHIMVWIKRCEAGGIKKDRQAFLSTPGGLDISQNKNFSFSSKAWSYPPVSYPWSQERASIQRWQRGYR